MSLINEVLKPPAERWHHKPPALIAASSFWLPPPPRMLLLSLFSIEISTTSRTLHGIHFKADSRDQELSQVLRASRHGLPRHPERIQCVHVFRNPRRAPGSNTTRADPPFLSFPSCSHPNRQRLLSALLDAVLVLALPLGDHGTFRRMRPRKADVGSRRARRVVGVLGRVPQDSGGRRRFARQRSRCRCRAGLVESDKAADQAPYWGGKDKQKCVVDRGWSLVCPAVSALFRALRFQGATCHWRLVGGVIDDDGHLERAPGDDICFVYCVVLYLWCEADG